MVGDDAYVHQRIEVGGVAVRQNLGTVAGDDGRRFRRGRGRDGCVKRLAIVQRPRRAIILEVDLGMVQRHLQRGVDALPGAPVGSQLLPERFQQLVAGLLPPVRSLGHLLNVAR